MSGASVCVLALNGRRQTVKCTPNTTILQILEEVCKKQNLKPEDYDLKHHNKILDTTSTFRFSGLPNNAQLELVSATKARLDTEVTLAVNLENGSRLIGNFNPSETLINILTKMCPECLGDNRSPVVIYTRREIYGQELNSVTLKSLGLTGGRAMIRVIDKDPEDLKQQANVSSIIPSKPVEEKPYIRKYQPTEPNVDSINNQDNSDKTDGQPTNVEKVQKKQNVDLIQLAREKRKSNEFPPKLLEGHKDVPEKQSKVSNTQNKGYICEQQKMEVDECSPKFEECDKEDDDRKEDFVFLGARNAMLFSQETASAVPSDELPDDFFDLTIDDARKLIRDVKRKRHDLENGPLLTSALRRLEESKRQLRNIAIYKKSIIRVQFPDRVVLQGTFATSDNIKDVIQFVREYLEDKSLNFYVYSTPPKCILAEDQNLLELGFVPGALIHFGTDQNSGESFLRRDLQDKFTSNSVASLAAAQIRRENMRKCTKQLNDDLDFDESPGMSSATERVNDGASTSAGMTQEYTERKIPEPTGTLPKWFRPM
uniref:Tether containing UBX domain for GLUT4 n=1 Tax=Diabrotica virgifera virgifera TaxID=50390 RepID=A0A6P7FGA0_DIAVI